ncbi:MAG TPA: amidophosphoribosyltransferase [Candidatus Omnitrophica bacterium]|nr:amidophosphoribosyltransferase [Candidatus Omnitrophota bacterium]
MSGIFGVISKSNCCGDLCHGVDYHSHLGTEYGGIAVLGKDGFSRRIHSINQSQFKSKFYEEIKSIEGDSGIGVISDFDEQPIFQNSKLGPFCIVTNGRIVNNRDLADKMFKDGITFSEVTRGGINMTELTAKLIAREDCFVSGIEKLFDTIKGACSLLILNQDGIYAARDKLGYSPLVVGRKGSAWAVTTESAAFINLGFEIVKYLEPGEIVLLNKHGFFNKNAGKDNMQICSFLWIYTGFPASCYEEINVEVVRERSGALLAKGDKNLKADLVCGVPDSGTAHAIGYAMESGVPFRRPLVKYTPGYGRSYTPPIQELRDLIATMKLVSIESIIKNNRIVLCEDSIVRGTQLKGFTIVKLWNAGATEIHVRIACPPLMFPCKYNISTRTTKELAARRAIRDIEAKDIEDLSEYLNPDSEKYKAMINWLTKDINVTTLRYQKLSDMVKAIGLPDEKLCLQCWIGDKRTKSGCTEKDTARCLKKES